MTPWTAELRWLVRQAAPMTGTQFCYTLLMPVTLASCGQLGTDGLGVAGLAISMYQLTVEASGFALRYALMPFLAQTGAGTKRHRVGFFLQRGLLAGLVLASVNWAVAMNSANLLVCLGQDPGLSVNTERFLVVLMPGCLGFCLGEALVAYADTLGQLWVASVSRCCCLACNVVLQLLLLPNFGLLGSAAALSVSLCLLPMLLALIIWCCGLHSATWRGFSARAFNDWSAFFLVLLPCLATQVSWTFGTEVGNFLAGAMGKTQIAVETVMFQVNNMIFLIPVGIGCALITRIGHYLGRGQAQEAKQVLQIGAVFITAVGAAGSVLVYLSRFYVPRLFSMEPAAADLYVQLTPYLSCYICLQLLGFSGLSGFRACSLHLQPMVINLLAYYVISMPIGIGLAFGANWHLHGVWVGFTAGSAAFAVLLLSYAQVKLNWQQLASSANEKAEMETDIELAAAEKQPLLQSTRQLSCSTAVRSQRQAPSCRAAVPIVLLLLLMTSLICRLTLPQPVVSMAARANESSTIFGNFTDAMQ